MLDFFEQTIQTMMSLFLISQVTLKGLQGTVMSWRDSSKEEAIL